MLIDQIIDLLGDESSSLAEALLKTKVLLHKIGKKGLAEWVNYELNGYPDKVEVPEYRVLQSKVLANVYNIRWRYPSHPIPIGHIEPEQRRHLEKAELRQSLSVMEKFGTSGFLQRDLPMEGNAKFEEGLTGGYHIERAWCQTPAHDVRGVLTQVRSRLLDFLLELKETLGDSEDDNIMKKKAQTIDAAGMFQNAIFGPNASIVVGDQNHQAIRNQVVKGNLDTLAAALEKAGFPNDEIESLKAAVCDDEAAGKTELFTGKTGKWFSNLLARAAKGGLEIGIDAASQIATSAITGYIGG